MKTSLFFVIWLLMLSAVNLAYAWTGLRSCETDGDCERSFALMGYAVSFSIVVTVLSVAGLILSDKNEKKQ